MQTSVPLATEKYEILFLLNTTFITLSNCMILTVSFSLPSDSW